MYDLGLQLFPSYNSHFSVCSPYLFLLAFIDDLGVTYIYTYLYFLYVTIVRCTQFDQTIDLLTDDALEIKSCYC